jgi:hypothetical protein
MPRWVYKLPLRFRSLFRTGRLDRELRDELRFHVDELVEKNVADGMAPDAARRAALRELGGMARIEAECRSVRVRPWSAPFSWIDVKLGMRMMRKFPGASIAIVLALAVGIPLSLLPNHLVGAALRKSPPFEDGERVVGVVGVSQQGRAALHVDDFDVLRERLTAFASLGAVIPVSVNVVSRDGWSQGEDAAVMTASVFELTRVRPMKGRVLLPADEVPGAPDVAVIGYRFWQRRLGGNADVVGSTLRIAGVPTTIVGLMPDGFAMPSTQQLWLPLRHRPAVDANAHGAAVWVYGRLADGVTLAQARAQATAVRLPARPRPRAEIRADVVAFSAVEVEEPTGALAWFLLAIAQVMPVIVLLIACGNAAILILARTAGRAGEVAVRTMLGASRLRIMGQLFVETLLLALFATGVGIVAIDIVISTLTPSFTLPFWFDPSITPVFVLKALGVSSLCAVVAGVLPAMRATSRTLQPAFQATGSGGSTLRLGRAAGALIVAESGCRSRPCSSA